MGEFYDVKFYLNKFTLAALPHLWHEGDFLLDSMKLLLLTSAF
jgi:hypothetical protein